MATMFENFRDWYKVFSVAKPNSDELNDSKASDDEKKRRFEERKQDYRKYTAFVLEKLAEENGENNEEYIESIVREGDLDVVKNHLKDGTDIYGNRVNEIMNNRIDSLYLTMPDDVKKHMHSLLESVKPKGNVAGNFDKAAELHAFIYNVSAKLKEYQSKETTPEGRTKLEGEMVKILGNYYDKAYSTTPEKAAESANFVKHMKEWIEKKPIVAVKTLDRMHGEKKKEFEKLVKAGDIKEYATAVLETDEHTKLIGTGIALYEQEEARERAKKNSMYLS